MWKTFEFDMDDPQGREDFEIHNAALDMYLTLHDLDNWLRGQCKHCEDKWSKETLKVFDDIRSMIRQRGVEI